MPVDEDWKLSAEILTWFGVKEANRVELFCKSPLLQLTVVSVSVSFQDSHVEI
jgi:hypothetical protein